MQLNLVSYMRTKFIRTKQQTEDMLKPDIGVISDVSEYGSKLYDKHSCVSDHHQKIRHVDIALTGELQSGSQVFTTKNISVLKPSQFARGKNARSSLEHLTRASDVIPNLYPADAGMLSSGYAAQDWIMRCLRELLPPSQPVCKAAC